MGHLRDCSDGEVRRAVETVAPHLVDEAIVVLPVFDVRPEWCRAACLVGDRHIIKVCWTAEAEDALRRQGRLMALLAGRDPALPLPEPIGVSDDPVAFGYELIPGHHLTYEDVSRLDSSARRRLASDLAGALAVLHDAATHRLVEEAGIALEPCRPQAGTDQIREFLRHRLEPALAGWLDRCLDRVDAVLAVAGAGHVVHGDFHGHNVLVDDRRRLRGVLDLEETAIGPAEYDLRYLPSHAPTLDLLDAVADAYAATTGRIVDDDAVLAWHVRTDLGDALWRTEAEVEVVGGPIEERTRMLRVRLEDRDGSWA